MLAPRRFRFYLRMLLACGLCCLPQLLQAQQEPDGEALLILSYPALGQVYLNTVFFDDAAFLPVGEVLSLFLIPHQRTPDGKGFTGSFPDKKDPWRIDPLEGKILIKGSESTLPADDFYMGEMDLYLRSDYFAKAFGLNFTVNLYALSLDLKTDQPLPIDDKIKREALRRRLTLSSPGQGEDAPLYFDRNRQVLGMGMLDYNLTYIRNNINESYQLNARTGTELMGGDLALNFSGGYKEDVFKAQMSSWLWRYVLPSGLKPEKNVLLSSIGLGNMGSLGNQKLIGLYLTNHSLLPRRQLDVYVIDGFTVTDSEVELLINGQLVDFMRADEVGYYRFNATLSYGNTKITIRIYTPQGEVIQDDRQMQVPFNFAPKGHLTYNLQAGLPKEDVEALKSGQGTGRLDLAYGLSRAITIRSAIDYLSTSEFRQIQQNYGLSARLFRQYLINLETLRDRYYRGGMSVIYGKGINITSQYTRYIPNAEARNPEISQDLNLNMNLPFRMFGQANGIRIGGDRVWQGNGFRNNLQADYSTRIGKLSTRFNYRTRLSGIIESRDQWGIASNSSLTGSMTYAIPRSKSLPVYVRGIFFRAQALYDPRTEQLQTASMTMSQTLFKKGRLSVSYDRNIQQRKAQFQATFQLDLNHLRSSSSFNQNASGYSINQSLNGSFGFDAGRNSFYGSNRDQVGRSGVSVRMFIDENNNGSYDKGEELVKVKGLNLDKPAQLELAKDGSLRISQLQNYWTYVLTMEDNALDDPTLAPAVKRFAFMAQPNNMYRIDIPLYRTGIIDGTVYFERNGMKEGLGGLRLLLKKEGEQEPVETLRTFSDGAFYAYGLMPGKYELEIDPQQLSFMQAEVDPPIMYFEIKAVAEGDYLENLDFVIRKKVLE